MATLGNPEWDWVTMWMGSLSFPLGFFFCRAASLLSRAAPGLSVCEDSVVAWVLLSVGGYVQWFCLLPRIIATEEIITIFPRANRDFSPKSKLDCVSLFKKVSVAVLTALFTFLLGLIGATLGSHFQNRPTGNTLHKRTYCPVLCPGYSPPCDEPCAKAFT